MVGGAVKSRLAWASSSKFVSSLYKVHVTFLRRAFLATTQSLGLDENVWVIIMTRHISSPTTCLRRIFEFYCSIVEQQDTALMCVSEDPQ